MTDLKESLKKLSSLLDAPEHGLSTWHEACQRIAQELQAELSKTMHKKVLDEAKEFLNDVERPYDYGHIIVDKLVDALEGR